MTKKDNLYSEVAINESPFYYDDHGRLRVHVLNEAQYISSRDMIIDPVTGIQKGPSKTIKISNDIPQQQTFARNPSGTQFNQSPPQTITKIGDFKITPEIMKSMADRKAQVASFANAPSSGIQNKPFYYKPPNSKDLSSGIQNKPPNSKDLSSGIQNKPGLIKPPNPKFWSKVRDPVTDKTGPSKTTKISKDITGMPLYGNDEPNSDMIARPAVMPPADRERPLPGTARIAVPRPDTARPPSNMKRPSDTARPPSNMKRPLPVRGTAPTAPVRGKPVRPIGGRPGLGRLSPIRSIVGSGRNTNIRTGLRGVRPAARAMQKSAPATDYLNEKMNLKTAKMGDVIKDFQKSDASQFEGKSKAKRRIMAIAAKLGAERMSERD